MKADPGLFLLPRVAALFIRGLHATLRVRHVHAERLESLHRAGSAYVYAFWHAHILVMVYALFRRPALVLISRHRDGELIARTVSRFGIAAARGSSTRGGSGGLRDLVRSAREGITPIITPDGPRGPRRVAQPGVVRVAQLGGIPVVPAAVVAEKKKVLESWDRFEIPMPFSRVIFLYGDPIAIPRDLSDEEFEEARLRVERAITELAEEGERSFGELWELNS